MVAEQIQPLSDKKAQRAVRLEVVDNAHKEWPAVSEWIERSGQSAQVWDQAGWLSARQIVVAAFNGEQVVGHLGFRVDPKRDGGKIVLEARIDSVCVERASIEALLFDRAQAHARLLGCRDLIAEA